MLSHEENIKKFNKEFQDKLSKQKAKKEANKKEREERKASHVGMEDYVNTKFHIFFEKIDFQRLGCLDNLSEAVKELKAEGLQSKTVVKQMYDIFCDGIDKLYKDGVLETWNFMKAVSQNTMFSQLEEGSQSEEESKYMWGLESSAEHCDDCLAREGQVKTFEEWKDEGLPGSGVTQCGNNCLCSLIEV